MVNNDRERPRVGKWNCRRARPKLSDGTPLASTRGVLFIPSVVYIVMLQPPIFDADIFVIYADISTVECYTTWDPMGVTIF